MSDNTAKIVAVLAIMAMLSAVGIAEAISKRACPPPFEGRSQPYP